MNITCLLIVLFSALMYTEINTKYHCYTKIICIYFYCTMSNYTLNNKNKEN